MIETSELLGSILRAGGYQRRFLADLIVDGTRVLTDVPLSSCTLRWDGRAKIRAQGVARFTYSDELGGSIVPRELTSWLTPYATFLNISIEVTLGDFSERIVRGFYKVVAVSDPEDSQILYQGRTVSLGSSVQLKLADVFAVTDRERFPVPSSPDDLSSTWAELGRVSGLALNRNVADSTISREVTYQESRLDALFDLAGILDGIPYVDPLGRLTIEPREWPAESEALTIGTDGQIIRSDVDDLSDEGIYNQVVVRSHDSEQSQILATANLPSGPLRYGGPFGRVPYFASSEFVTTTAQALAYAADLLPTVSAIPAARFTIDALPDPRREVGDVVPFVRLSEELVGRIEELTLSSAGPMTLKVAVDRG